LFSCKSFVLRARDFVPKSCASASSATLQAENAARKNIAVFRQPH
jgi:hypothetical protein